MAPDAIHKNVKTFKENMKNFHFLAPEQTGKILLFFYSFSKELKRAERLGNSKSNGSIRNDQARNI